MHRLPDIVSQIRQILLANAAVFRLVFAAQSRDVLPTPALPHAGPIAAILIVIRVTIPMPLPCAKAAGVLQTRGIAKRYAWGIVPYRLIIPVLGMVMEIV